MAWDVVEDDWNLSCEELDRLEKDALRQIKERKSSSAASASCPPPPPPPPNHSSPPPPPHHSSPPSPTTLPSSSSLTSFPPHSHQAATSVPSSFLHRPESQKVSAKDAVTDLPNLSVKLFLHSSGNITAKFAYHPILVDAFRKVPKASWVAKERVWMFPISSLPLAEKVLSEIKGAHVEVLSIDPLVQSALAAAACASDLRDHYDQIPIFIESKLLPFQRDGVRFMLQHGGRVLLADEMGLGKTLQTIAFISCVRDFWPVLVLTPSSLRLHWASMLQQWLKVPSRDILVVLSQGGSNRQGFTIVPSNVKDRIHFDALFNIVSYDMVPKLQDVLMASDFKIVIADESHFLKNAQAKRTKASLPVLKKAQFAILLTGTPALSRPIELFKQLEALYPDVYKNVHEYGNRYCKGGVFGLYQGASNHEELHNLMKVTVMIRRLKKDVLAELPRKRRQQVFLDLDEKNMKHINSLFCQLGIIKSQIKACKSAEEAKTLKFSEKNLINRIYNDSAEAKIPAVLDYLSNVIEAGCKFLVFAHHQPMLMAIHQFLQKKKVGCIRIDGTTQQSSRPALVAEFQEKEDIKAAVLSIKAAGVGLTLTAASTVIFAELSWTPGDIIQAEDRVHRIGQASSVNVYYLLANDTVDDIIWDVVQSKLENLGQMLDGREDSLEVSVSRLCHSSTESGTLDSFLKRCHTAIDGGSSGGSPKSKCPKI